MVDVSPSRRRAASWLLGGLAAVLLLPATAHAQTDPSVEACAGKAEGNPCGLTTMVKPESGGELERKTVPGVCRTAECCELDYSKGSPPQSVCSACLQCKEGPADVAAADDGKSADPPPPEGEAPRAADDGPPAPNPGQKRGCRIGDEPAGPWAALLCIGLWARRRSSSPRP